MRYTKDMTVRDRRCRREHGLSLRDYLIKRSDDDPMYRHEAMAEELGVHLSTLYTYYDRLELGRATRLIDLREPGRRVVVTEAEVEAVRKRALALPAGPTQDAGGE